MLPIRANVQSKEIRKFGNAVACNQYVSIRIKSKEYFW